MLQFVVMVMVKYCATDCVECFYAGLFYTCVYGLEYATFEIRTRLEHNNTDGLLSGQFLHFCDARVIV